MVEPVSVASVGLSVNAELHGNGAVTVTGITHDSTRATPGSLFCCVVGRSVDGHQYASDAVGRGSVALLVERSVDVDVPQLVVPSVRRTMGTAAAEVFGHPSREIAVIGVTGTNGKTTTVTLIAHVLDTVGRSTEVIGTLTGPRTTPEATDLQGLLREAVDAGRRAVAMEVSSHALDLHRVDGVDFAVTVFTNLGLDHLDHHGTSERYFEAKSRLFEPGRAPIAVINVDDVHGRLLRDTVKGQTEVVEISVADLGTLALDSAGAGFRWRGLHVTTPLVGRHNVANALAAAEACVALGVEPSAVAEALRSAPSPPGRFEPVDDGQPFAIIVDYAHTPDALEGLLEAVREITPNRVIVVFGCGGDRDPSKRTRMGEVAGRLADVVVITSDNPRSEDPSTIMAAVQRGVEGVQPRLEPDRRTAIRMAVTDARSGDSVVIAGKGHETTQTIGTFVTPFDDRIVAREEVARLRLELDS